MTSPQKDESDPDTSSSGSTENPFLDPDEPKDENALDRTDSPIVFDMDSLGCPPTPDINDLSRQATIFSDRSRGGANPLDTWIPRNPSQGSFLSTPTWRAPPTAFTVSPGQPPDPSSPGPWKRVGHSVCTRAAFLVKAVFDPILAQTFYCIICSSYEQMALGYRVSGCGHRFCRLCLAEVVKIQIFLLKSMNQSQNIRCPFSTCQNSALCPNIMSDSDIQSLISNSDVWHAYLGIKRAGERYLLVHPEWAKEHTEGPADRPVVRCMSSRCAALQTHSPPFANRKQEQGNIVECHQCSRWYCWYHGLLHKRDEKCSDFEEGLRKDVKKVLPTMDEYPVCCPRCAAPRNQFTNCNWMVCLDCELAWCHLCEEKVDGENHYTQGSCKGFAFRSKTRYRVRKNLYWISLGPLVGAIAYMVISLTCRHCMLKRKTERTWLDGDTISCIHHCGWRYYHGLAGVMRLIGWLLMAILWLLFSIVVIPILYFASPPKLKEWLSLIWPRGYETEEDE